MQRPLKDRLVNRFRRAGFEVVRIAPRAGEKWPHRLLVNAMRAAGFAVFKPRARGNTPHGENGAAENAGSDDFQNQIPAGTISADPRVNRMEDFRDFFAGIEPWKGHVPKGFMVDFSGALTDASFRTMWGIDPATTGDSYHETRLPEFPKDEEGWFEAFNWVAAAREAKDRFVMLTLGACYGAQAVGSYRMLMQLNPMPCKLVAVEPDPGNVAWIKKNFRDNGIDPDDHWIVSAALNDNGEPALFPVGAPGWGAGGCLWTNNPIERERLAARVIGAGAADDALEDILVNHRTGIKMPLLSGQESPLVELRYTSAVTLNDLLAPFDRVDYIESDLQHSEVLVFPSAVEQLRRKVRRVHIGTHSEKGHRQLHRLFQQMGWEITFSFEPLKNHQTSLGEFWINDGVLSVVNPDLRN
jgi:hypothetical protein